MKSARVLIFLLSLGAMVSHSQLHSPDTMDRLAQEFRTQLKTLTSPALEERRRTRAGIQRNGYANTLMNVLGQDAVAAAVAYARMKLLIEYAVSHRPLFISVPVARGEGRMVALALIDDWSFPADPWKRE